MKKQIISPICSAFIIPGLGQAINGNIRKSIILLVLVFILFIGGTVKLAITITTVLTLEEIKGFDSKTILEKLHGEDFSVVFILCALYLCLWLYSVVDAFLTGRKIDKTDKDKGL